MPESSLPRSLPAALRQQLGTAAQGLQETGLRALFETDPERAKRLTLEHGEIYLDYSKNLITDEVLSDLLDWAAAVKMPERIQALLSGEKVNVTENRAALHTALRKPEGSQLLVDGQDVMPAIYQQRAKMSEIVSALHQKKWLGSTGKPISAVVHIGIGGSDLGPVMACEALEPLRVSDIALHFVSNIDPTAMDSVLAQVTPETTLFIISSKSFGTPETLANAQLAKDWLHTHLGEKALAQHGLAVTASPDKAKAFGIAPSNILSFEKWVGGRYSIWSTIGLPLAIQVGMAQFEAFLAGAYAMDQHFSDAPLAENMPVLLALLGAWDIHFLAMPSVAVLPYAEGLKYLPAYLQQLDMESNGKSVQSDGQPVTGSTGPVVWGQAGTNGQHAFYQLLHQGSHAIAMDFILVANSASKNKTMHQQLLANGLAQTQALMQGRQGTDLAPTEIMPGNKPTNCLLLKSLSPFAFGQLLALYEHKVFVQGVLWGINSFDQPGVELGKVLAKNIEDCFEDAKHSNRKGLDFSTLELLEKIQKFQQS